jgi:hypothetical protein
LIGVRLDEQVHCDQGEQYAQDSVYDFHTYLILIVFEIYEAGFDPPHLTIEVTWKDYVTVFGTEELGNCCFDFLNHGF